MPAKGNPQPAPSRRPQWLTGPESGPLRLVV